FTAGAHIDVHLPGGMVRQYSLCGRPGEASRYVIAVLRDDNGLGGSKCLHDSWQKDQIVSISEPRNNFPLHRVDNKVILLAGGIGITPLKSMLHVLADNNSDFELHYCAKDISDVAFEDAMVTSETVDRVHLHLDGGDPQNGLDIAALLSKPEPDTEIYYCGPAGFMKACANAAEAWPADA